MLLYIFLILLPIAVIGQMNGNRLARPFHDIPKPQPAPHFVKTLESQYTTMAPTENIPLPKQVVSPTQRPLGWAQYYPQRLVAQPMPAVRPAADTSKSIIPLPTTQSTIQDPIISSSENPASSSYTYPASYDSQIKPKFINPENPITEESEITISSTVIPEKIVETTDTTIQQIITTSPFETSKPVEEIDSTTYVYDRPVSQPTVTPPVQYIGDNYQVRPLPNYARPQIVIQPTTSAPNKIGSTTIVPIESFKEPERTYARPVLQPKELTPTQYQVRPLPAYPRPQLVAPAKTLPPVYTSVSLAQQNPKYASCSGGHKYFAVPQECDSYIECKNNIQAKVFCPDGLLFNIAAKWPEYPCVYPSDVKCVGEIKQTPQPSGECPRQYGYFPAADTDCGNYLMCQQGKAVMMKCPSGLAFNAVTNTCDWPDNVGACNVNALQGFTCPTPPLDEFGKPSDIILKYRYGESCKQYIACQSGHPRLLSCDNELSFDDSSQVCIESKLVPNCSS